jgi:hypothetical protein
MWGENKFSSFILRDSLRRCGMTPLYCKKGEKVSGSVGFAAASAYFFSIMFRECLEITCCPPLTGSGEHCQGALPCQCSPEPDSGKMLSVNFYAFQNVIPQRRKEPRRWGFKNVGRK